MSLLIEKLASRPLVRQLTDVVMSRYALRRVAQLDRRPVGILQRRTLLQLVRHARHTRFGRDHHFAGIDTIADFQRRVPLRNYEAFWSEYWSGPFPYEKGVTWPGRLPYFAVSSGTTSGVTKYIPVSREMLASNQRAALTAFALYFAAHPGTPLFTGRLFFLGGSTDLIQPGIQSVKRPPILAGDLSAIAACEASPWLRPFTFPPVDLALLQDWNRKLDLLAERAAKLPITMLSGVPSWLLALFERLKKVTGRNRVTDVWPGLRLVIHGGTRFDPYRALFRRELGNDVYLLDTYPASEAYIASEDPRYGMLRLLPDHNIFFEFVPVDELHADQPARHTVEQVEPGVQYAVVVTTCAGLWSYVIGDTVCFERRNPPLLRFSGRTSYFLSAFGEHLISEEIERAIASAAETCDTAVVDFHVGPVFSETPAAPGKHRYFVEFAGPITDVSRFVTALDSVLCNLNEDYEAHRRGNVAILPPEICIVRPGGFADWMRSRGKLGGQHKVPRMDNTGQLTEQLSTFFRAAG